MSVGGMILEATTGDDHHRQGALQAYLEVVEEADEPTQVDAEGADQQPKKKVSNKDRKNALEEYVYIMRGRFNERYVAYVKAQEKEALLKASAPQDAADWLYSEEGEDATKSAHVERRGALKELGGPITSRYKEAKQRSMVVSQLRETINRYMSEATSSDKKDTHIDDKDRQAAVETPCATIQQWLEDQIARQSERPKGVDPVLTAADVLKKKDNIIYFAMPILTRPKPNLPPKTETPSGTETPKSGTETPNAQQPPQEGEAPKESQGPSEMDFD
ncbi:uncharacterized protein C8Q71DRAFT_888920 [Rhodofomes roseus]|uniref:Uncharacterized protein n=1 Tax=Rhodofomes roseus TaxID=34475 RepID=A0ABQ8JYR2_9APHY|nr:uncharacterized protein C8Q71DRAFT_888920 [Rhodofomes roseus]KAH9829405.1 hypothetical protein C8Q71DRAFT_888920 [Rhodofomes roseus]